MDGYRVIVMKSTVPVGTARGSPRDRRGRSHRAPLRRRLQPRVLKEGAAIEDFLKPDRVVIGCDRQACRRDREGSLRPVRRSGRPILVMDNAQRRDDQVRGQRAARDQDLVHERDREPVRAGRCRRRHVRQGVGVGRPHRH